MVNSRNNNKRSKLAKNLAVYKCPPILDPSTLENFKKDLKEQIQHVKGNLTLDGAGLKKVNTQAVQIILSAAKTLENSSRKLILKNPSDVLCSAFEDLGFQSEILKWREGNA